MPRIRTVADHEATGELKRQYEAAIERAGRVFNVVRIQSLDPAVMEKSIGLYQTLMLAPSSLPRAEREMIATVVARELDCFY